MTGFLLPGTGSKACRAGILFHDARGSNAVEFALILPVLLVILLGMIYVGIYFSVGHSLAQIAADASRYAMVGLDGEERARLAARWIDDPDRIYGVIDNSRLRVSTSEKAGALKVTLAYDMTHLPTPPIIGAVVAFPSRMERSSTVLVP